MIQGDGGWPDDNSKENSVAVICPVCRNYTETNTGVFLYTKPLTDDSVEIANISSKLQKKREGIAKVLSAFHANIETYGMAGKKGWVKTGKRWKRERGKWLKMYMKGGLALKWTISNKDNDPKKNLVYYNCDMCGSFGFLPRDFLVNVVSQDLKKGGGRACPKKEWDSLLERLK